MSARRPGPKSGYLVLFNDRKRGHWCPTEAEFPTTLRDLRGHLSEHFRYWDDLAVYQCHPDTGFVEDTDVILKLAVDDMDDDELVGCPDWLRVSPLALERFITRQSRLERERRLEADHNGWLMTKPFR